MTIATAIVHIDVESDLIPEVAEEIVAIKGVTEVFSVTGIWDLMAIVRVRDHEELADVIPNKISKVKGVTNTETQLAFRTYSQHDLESAFSIGLD